MSNSDFESIPRLRRVIYTTYGNFPTSGLAAGDLAYATDRLVFYRWNSAAWQNVTVHVSAGLFANRPAVATLPNGSQYFSTDTNVFYQVIGGAWASVSSAGVWTIIETVTPSNVSTISFATFTAYDMIKIIISLSFDTGATSDHTIQLRLNNDAGNNYSYREVDNTTIATIAAASSLVLGESERRINANTRYGISGEVILQGKAVDTAAACRISVIGGVCGLYPRKKMINGDYTTNSNITELNILSSTNFDGNISLLGLNF